MTSYKIEHQRSKCIQCGACALVQPEFWEMNPKDYKANLKGSTKPNEGLDFEERVVSKEEATHNKEARDVCPVNCIMIKETVKT